MKPKTPLRDQLNGYVVELSNLLATVKAPRPLSPHILLERLEDLRRHIESHRDSLTDEDDDQAEQLGHDDQAEQLGQLVPSRPAEPAKGNAPRRRKEPPEGTTAY